MEKLFFSSNLHSNVGPVLPHLPFFSPLPEDIFFIACRERGRERENKIEKCQCERETSTGCLLHKPRLGNLGMCPDPKSNLQPFGYGTTLQCSKQLSHTCQGDIFPSLEKSSHPVFLSFYNLPNSLLGMSKLF